MTINVTTPTTHSNIAALRVKAIEAETSNYGARRAYAAGLNDIADCAWFELEGKLPEAIAGEKKAYYDGLKAIGYSNPSNAWKMVKQYAKADAIARAMFGVVADAEPETQGAGNKARPLDVRLIDDLVALYKQCAKQDSLSKKQEGAFKGIKEALKAMGVDIALINEGK
jgi:hypothetical protein